MIVEAVAIGLIGCGFIFMVSRYTHNHLKDVSRDELIDRLKKIF